MRTLYIDCGMGAAGDMLTAALLELVHDRNGFLNKLNNLGIPGVWFEIEDSVKCGIKGSHVSVKVHGVEEGEHHNHDHHHHHESHSHGDMTHTHSGIHDIAHLVWDHLHVSEHVKRDITAVYQIIAEAESHVHGVPVDEIHFHEVGTLDAVADIAAVCLLMEELAPDQVIVSPVHVGSGQVHCAHGILPVPAPATAYILKDVPIYGGKIRGELCTPTGAALLKHFATKFGDMPVIQADAIGYGMGKKDFEAANCVRAMIGTSAGKRDSVWELSCNVDDMTSEAIGFAMERLFEAGAVDVYTVPIGMKKSRPGVLIHVMCKDSEKLSVVKAIFKYTTTIGIRENQLSRYVLDRHVQVEETPYGQVRCKISSGYGVERKKYEYDDLAKIAKEQGMSIREVSELIKK